MHRPGRAFAGWVGRETGEHFHSEEAGARREPAASGENRLAVDGAMGGTIVKGDQQRDDLGEGETTA